MTKLLPCPFCGYPVDLVTSKNAPDRLIVITCTGDSPCIGSGLGGFYILESQREEGIAAWNRRSPSIQSGAVVPDGWKLVPVEPTEEQIAPRPLDDWHEDMGDVVWWCLRDGQWLGEAPYIGSPLDLGRGYLVPIGNQEFAATLGGWPGYHTHFTPLPARPALPVAAAMLSASPTPPSGDQS